MLIARMEHVQWIWPPPMHTLIHCQYRELDPLIKQRKVIVLSVGLLKVKFKNVCHGIRACFAWAKKNDVPVYIRHLEDFGDHCELNDLKQLLIGIQYATNENIPIIAFTEDPSKCYNIVKNHFKYEMQLVKQKDSFSNVPIEHATFADVNGRQNIKEMVLSLFNNNSNVEGVIFHGLPGKGKTLMARALFGELSKSKKVYFLNIAIHDILKSHVGESEAAIQALFKCSYDFRIIFMDELDVLFSDIENYTMKILWQLHAEIDKVVDNPNKKTFIIGATNYIDSIPDSLLRRLPSHIYFD